MDTQKLTIQFSESEKKPFAFPGELEKRHFVFRPEETNKTEASPLVQTDFYGTEVQDDKCLPGPFAELTSNQVYAIDPRKEA